MATAPVSVSAEFKIATQTVIGTPATTGFICGRMKESTLLPAFEELNPGAEHYCGNSNRPTLKKSLSIRSAYMGVFGGTWFLYPEMIGIVLRGLGFDKAVAGTTPEYTHTFTIADRDAAVFVTVLQQIGEGSDAFERRAVGGRVAKFDMLANSKGIICSMQGVAVDVDNSTGSETSTNEPSSLITATDGTLTAEVDGSPIVSNMKIRSSRLQIANPVDVSDTTLFNPERADLPQLGVAVNGSLMGVDVSTTLWNKMYRNGSTSGSPSLVIPQMDLSYTFESPSDITGGANPFSITVEVPKAEVRMTPYQASGRNLIRCNLEWEMIDDGSEPITITLVNSKASYV